MSLKKLIMACEYQIEVKHVILVFNDVCNLEVVQNYNSNCSDDLDRFEDTPSLYCLAMTDWLLIIRESVILKSNKLQAS